MNYDNLNACVAPVLNNDCCVKSTTADRTIKDNIDICKRFRRA